ncbi:hypothetical protein CCR97_21140 [Rhodoplanes elegans]|uniref:Uncharacterized protein n=1 Tax=Rhodoplanes elegans TaxID=29408 RepID=A0A327KLG2_9BRAD|nr:hypothetical protein [Rhodoplanes elegans]MBK5960688.1 hypothetical protein [Rhodoplanes elegans]RAI39081.1 hypothetical protein CH338_10580 [Rhodoplanes elegans]
MATIKNLEVMNGLLFLRDPGIDNIPEMGEYGSCWSNPDCVVFSCQFDCFGPTKVSLGPSNELRRAPVLIFDGVLNTPSRTVIVETVMSEPALTCSVEKATTRVRIWTLGNPDSEIVDIGLD